MPLFILVVDVVAVAVVLVVFVVDVVVLAVLFVVAVVDCVGDLVVVVIGFVVVVVVCDCVGVVCVVVVGVFVGDAVDGDAVTGVPASKSEDDSSSELSPTFILAATAAGSAPAAENTLDRLDDGDDSEFCTVAIT